VQTSSQRVRRNVVSNSTDGWRQAAKASRGHVVAPAVTAHTAIDIKERHVSKSTREWRSTYRCDAHKLVNCVKLHGCRCVGLPISRSGIGRPRDERNWKLLGLWLAPGTMVELLVWLSEPVIEEAITVLVDVRSYVAVVLGGSC
jgi:hypothetical protein